MGGGKAADKAGAPAGAAAAGAASAATTAAVPAFDYAASVRQHPQLSEEEKQAVLWVLAQSPAFAHLITEEDIGLHAMPAWVHCAGLLGIQVSRQDPVAPERVYKMRGITEVPASTEVTYDLVTEFEQMQKWDAMLQSLEVLERNPKQYPVTRIGTFINTYGVPGLSWLFHERQFLCHGVGVHFPDGTRALAIYSPPDGTHPLDPGVTKPRTIRAHMGTSGYVVTPWAGEDRQFLGTDRCQVTMVLQVDPKGSVPLPVYNATAMIMPMNLQRVKMAAAKLKPEEVAEMLQRQAQVVDASKAEAAKAEAAKA